MEGKIMKAFAYETKNGNAFAGFVVAEKDATDVLHKMFINPNNVTFGFEGDIIAVDAIANCGVEGLAMVLKATIGLSCDFDIADDDDDEGKDSHLACEIPENRITFLERMVDKFISRG